jgi:hypothetical protein
MNEVEKSYVLAVGVIHQYVKSVQAGTRKYDQATLDRLILAAVACGHSVTLSKLELMTTVESHGA